MDAVFLKLLNMSLTASWIVLAVLILRLLLKRAPKWINCLLWGVVGLRLIFPFSIESLFSLIPSAEPLPSDLPMTQTPAIDSGFEVIDQVVNPIIYDSFAPTPTNSANPMQIVIAVAAIVWLCGLVGMIAYGAISYLRLRLRVRASICQDGNVYLCDDIDSPFILGVIRPRIYLPSGMTQEQMGYVIGHERAHLRRLDHVWKPIGFVLLCLHWFNPMLWVAYILLCRDIEKACDEKVIRDMDDESKKGYSETLVACSVHRRAVMACPLAFGEVGVKDRIKSVLHYKKPAFWIILVAVVALVVTGVCFLTDPPAPENNNPGDIEYYEWTGEYNEEAFIKAANGYLQHEKTPYKCYDKFIRITAAFPIKTCRVLGSAPVTGDAQTEYQAMTDSKGPLLNVEGTSAYVDLSWWDNMSNIPGIQFNLYALWSHVVELTDMDGVKHYYYFRVNYSNWPYLSPDQPQPSLNFTAWDFEATPEFTLPEFDGIRFVSEGPGSFGYQIKMINGAGDETKLIAGMPRNRAFFADLNQDGYPELLGEASYGSGMVSNYIVVHDIKNGERYRLHERGYWDFYLSHDNDALSVTIVEYDTARRSYQAVPVLAKSDDGYVLELRNGSEVLYRTIDNLWGVSLFPQKTAYYVFNPEAKATKRSSLSLYEDQVFLLDITPVDSMHVDSHPVLGTYEIKDNRLYLTSYDKQYVYVFKINDDSITYRASWSSGNPPTGNFTNRSEFVKK